MDDDKMKVLEIVADYYNTTIAEVTARRRFRGNIEARQIAMYIMVKDMKCMKVEVGRFFGFDHTTVIHNVRRIKDIMDTESDTFEDYVRISETVKSVLIKDAPLQELSHVQLVCKAAELEAENARLRGIITNIQKEVA